jgi:hypothetical protein
VACTTALKAKAMSGKRVTKERQASSARRQPDAASENWDQLQTILDEELKELPDLYRTVIVLGDLEGKPIKDAARELDCPAGTVGPRLARGRRMLAKRLVRRGISLPAGMLAAALMRNTAMAVVPPLLLHSTVNALEPFVTGQAVLRGAISQKVASLTEGVIKSMFLTKLKVAAGALVVIAVVALSVVGAKLPSAHAQTSPKSDNQPAKSTQVVRPHSPLSAAPGELAQVAMLQEDKGNKKQKQAIAAALEWIADRQKGDGSWEYDGVNAAVAGKVPATGMAVLAFLGAGITHKSKDIHQKAVDNGVKFLLSEQKITGRIGDKTMYTHAIATLAICEAFGMTSDAGLKPKAQKAIDFIVASQAANGSWGYDPGKDGDTSILGWQIQALKSAKLAGLKVPDVCLTNAGKFLDIVSCKDGSQYSYRGGGVQPSSSMSASGLLSRFHIGTPPEKEVLSKGLASLWESAKPDEKAINTYYLFFATQLFHQAGGDAWEKDWSPSVREALLKLQVTTKTKGAKVDDIGSWPKDTGSIGVGCGRLGSTCMSALILEVSDERLPLFKKVVTVAKKMRSVDDSGLNY